MQRLWWLFLITDRTNFNIKILVYIAAERIDLAKVWKPFGSSHYKGRSSQGNGRSSHDKGRSSQGKGRSSHDKGRSSQGEDMKAMFSWWSLWPRPPSSVSTSFWVQPGEKTKHYTCHKRCDNVLQDFKKYCDPGLFETFKLSIEGNWLDGYSPAQSIKTVNTWNCVLWVPPSTWKFDRKIAEQEMCCKYLRIKEKLRCWLNSNSSEDPSSSPSYSSFSLSSLSSSSPWLLRISSSCLACSFVLSFGIKIGLNIYISVHVLKYWDVNSAVSKSCIFLRLFSINPIRSKCVFVQVRLWETFQKLILTVNVEPFCMVAVGEGGQGSDLAKQNTDEEDPLAGLQSYAASSFGCSMSWETFGWWGGAGGEEGR